MINRRSMFCPITGRLPAGLGCLWIVVALSRWPSQAAGVLLPDAPSGFAAALPGMPSGFGDRPTGELPDGGLGETLLDGLSLGATFSSTYNSNVSPTQTQNTADDMPKDDFILSLGGTLNYLSQAAGLTFGGNYRGSYNQYFNHVDFSGYSQGGGLVANYEGGRFSVSALVGMSVDRGSNTNYSSAFVQQTSINAGLTVRYRISPKTSLQGSLNQSSTSSSSGYSGTGSYSLNVAALWQYSPLTEFGPGIRYSTSSGGTQTTRTTIGPTLNVNYKLSAKVALNSRVGMDFASYASGASADPTFSTSLGVNYQASKLWGMNLSLYRDTQADPSTAGAYTAITSLRIGYHRTIRRATWSLGTSCQTNTSVIPGSSSGGGRPDQKSFSIDTSLGMPLFANTTFGSVFVRLNDQRGGSTNSYNTVQVGLSLSRSF